MLRNLGSVSVKIELVSTIAFGNCAELWFGNSVTILHDFKSILIRYCVYDEHWTAGRYLQYIAVSYQIFGPLNKAWKET